MLEIHIDLIDFSGAFPSIQKKKNTNMRMIVNKNKFKNLE